MRLTKTVPILSIVIVLLAAFAGCGGGGGEREATTTAAGGASAKSASASEQRQATESAKGFFAAQGAKRWAAACEQLASTVRRILAAQAKSDTKPGEGCAAGMAAFASRASNPPGPGAADIRVLDLRVNDDAAFLIYKSAAGATAALPMRREGGEWKVAVPLASSRGQAR